MKNLPESIVNVPSNFDKKHTQFWEEVAKTESIIMNDAYDNEHFVSDNAIEIITHAKNAAAKLLALSRNLALGMDMDSPTVKRDFMRAAEGAGLFVDAATDGLSATSLLGHKPVLSIVTRISP